MKTNKQKKKTTLFPKFQVIPISCVSYAWLYLFHHSHRRVAIIHIDENMCFLEESYKKKQKIQIWTFWEHPLNQKNKEYAFN